MDSEWIDDPRGRTLRVGDRVRYIDLREVGPERVIQHASATGFTVDALPAVWRPRDYSTAHDRVLASTRWQYHAPTRAKLEDADREHVTVTSITDDTMTVRPAPTPDSEPGWDHVPAEYYDVGSRFSVGHGDKLIRPGGEWCAIRGPIHITGSCSEYWVRRASHPERVRWLEEQNRAVNTDSAIVAAVDSESTYACAPSKQKFPGAVIHCPECGVTVAEGDWCSCVTEAERERHYANVRDRSVLSAPTDPFAAVRAEAKRMMDDGADPRLVLGALDDCTFSGQPERFNSQIAYRTKVEAERRAWLGVYRANKRCYHGNRAGTCGWCALARERSDSRAVAPHEPAWETADCEGE